MDVRYVNPFVESIDNVFTTMLQTVPRRAALRVSDRNGSGAALTSLIGITGQVHGVVVLRFPPETALSLASRMLMSECAEVNDDVVDAISEVVNMVAGAAKAKFQCDPPLQLGLPTVVDGANYRVKYPSKSVWLEIPFESDAGSFTLELTFSADQKTRA